MGPKIFLWYPILGFLTLKSTKKWCFSSKTKIGPQFWFTGSWPKKSNFEGIKILFGLKIFLGYPILKLLTPKSTKRMDFFIKNVTKLAIFQHANFLIFLMKKIIFWYFQGPRILKLGTSNIFWGPKIFWHPQSWIFWARSLWIGMEVLFLFLMKIIISLVLLRVKNPKNGVHQNCFGFQNYFDPLKVGIFWARRLWIDMEVQFPFFSFSEKFYNIQVANISVGRSSLTKTDFILMPTRPHRHNCLISD